MLGMSLQMSIQRVHLQVLVHNCATLEIWVKKVYDTKFFFPGGELSFSAGHKHVDASKPKLTNYAVSDPSLP